MKFFLSLLLLSISIGCKASIILELDQKDSIHYKFMYMDTILYGNSAKIEVKGKKFQIGVFGFNNSDANSKNKRGIIAIYKLDVTGKSTFFQKFDLLNSALVSYVKYLIIESEIYSITVKESDKLTLEKYPDVNRPHLKEADFLECIYDINYFDGKYTDSVNNVVPSSVLFKKGKLNIIYYTITYCQPCESAKQEMNELSSNKKVNLNFVTESGVNFDKIYKTKQKYFYERSLVKNAFGYPLLLLFDGQGNFIKMINKLNSSIITSIKNDADSYK